MCNIQRSLFPFFILPAFLSIFPFLIFLLNEAWNFFLFVNICWPLKWDDHAKSKDLFLKHHILFFAEFAGSHFQTFTNQRRNNTKEIIGKKKVYRFKLSRLTDKNRFHVISCHDTSESIIVGPSVCCTVADTRDGFITNKVVAHVYWIKIYNSTSEELPLGEAYMRTVKKN